MTGPMSVPSRIRARDAALRKLDRLTTGVAVSAFAGVGLLGTLIALTAPGASPVGSATPNCASTSTAGATNPDDAASDDSSAAATSIQTSSCKVSSPSGAAVVVTGGSHPVK